MFKNILVIFSLLVTIVTVNCENATQFKSVQSTICNKCRCVKMQDNTLDVDCRSRKLDEFPASDEVSGSIRKLDLSNNEITELNDISFYDNLSWLSLTNNRLHTLSPTAFKKLKVLRYLDLSYNQITSFHSKQFEDLKDLQTLNFSYCRIEILPKNIFENNFELITLQMGHNPLRFLDDDLFKPLNHLVELSINHNEIFSLPSGAFSTLGHLQELDLSANLFEDVPINALRALKWLKKLDLSDNPIKKLNKYSFYQLNSLKKLTLRNTKLFEITANTFSTLYALEDVLIEDNPQLMYIDRLAFDGIFNHSKINIKRVSFKRNRLATLSAYTLPFCNLTSLDLRENPWTCDCHLRWVSYCHERAHILPGVECSNPINLRAHFADSIDPSKLVCTETNEITYQVTHAYLFYMTFFMMCMLFFMGIFLYSAKYAAQPGAQRSSIYYLKAQTAETAN